MKRIKVNEIKKIASDGGYKTICLKNAKDEFLVKINTPTIPIEKRIEMIVQRLKSPGVSDGVYTVQMGSTHTKGTTPDIFEIVKGTEVLEPEVLGDVGSLEANTVRSFNSAIEDKGEIQKLIFEKEILVRDNARLESELEHSRSEMAELKEEIDQHFEEEAEGLAENEPSKNLQFFQGIADTLAPIVQGIVDNVKDSNNIRAAQLMAGNQFNSDLLSRQPNKPKGKFDPEADLFGFNSVEEIMSSEELEPGEKPQVVSNWLNNLSHLDPKKYETEHLKVL